MFVDTDKENDLLNFEGFKLYIYCVHIDLLIF